MVSVAYAVALAALLASFTAINISSSLDHHQLGDTTPAQAVQALLPLAAMGALLAAVASIYQKLHRAATAGAGAGTEVAVAILCAAVGLLVQFVVCKSAAQGDNDGARARELGMAAAQVLPAAATTTFFLGVALIFVRVRTSGGAVAGEGPVQILVKTGLGATASVLIIGLMALTF